MTFIDPAAKLWGHLDKLALLEHGGKPWPINLEVDLSNRCSLGCEWCHFAHTHTRGPLAKKPKPAGLLSGGDLMDTELALRLIDQVAPLGISVTWTGGGEPTLHPEFDRVVKHGMKRDIAQALYTHGAHIGVTRAELLSHAMRFVYVSLDAANRESYLRAKSVDKFDDACEGIHQVATASGDATVGVGFLVTKRNWRDAPDAARLARDLKATYIQFRPTILFDHDTPDASSEDTGWMDEAVALLADLHAQHPGFVLADLDRFDGYRRWSGHGYPTCWWSALQAVVTPSGQMWTCVNKREHPAALIGDLSVEDFETIWERRPVADVDGSCRVMCRGHLANLALTEVFSEHPHPEFV